MKRGLILIPYANKEAYKTGVNLCSSNRLEVYLKNCCVACMSAKQNACQQADVALVTNIDIGKNGADCYNKNGHAVTVLTRQS